MPDLPTFAVSGEQIPLSRMNTGHMARLWRFAHHWLVPAPVADVYAVCAAVAAYPTWWREVRSVERLDDTSGVAVVRSALPWTLRLGIAREVEDEVAGRLRVRLDGDLTGWAEFVIGGDQGGEGGASEDFRQEVEVTAPALRRLVPVLAPALRANHALMMRSCRRGMEQVLGARS